ATLGNQTVHGGVTVVDYVTLSSVYVNNQRLEVGSDVRLYSYLNAVPAGQTTVTVTSSDTTVAPTPDPINVTPGSTYGYGSAHAGGPGVTTLTFTAGTSSLTAPMTVVAKASLSSVTGTTNAAVGVAGSVNVNYDAALASARQVTLTSSDTSVLTV